MGNPTLRELLSRLQMELQLDSCATPVFTTETRITENSKERSIVNMDRALAITRDQLTPGIIKILAMARSRPITG